MAAASTFVPKWAQDIHNSDPTPLGAMLGIGDEIEADPNVVAALPLRYKYLSAIAHGFSQWTRTAKIATKKEEDGTECFFFMKVATGENGRIMLRGEYEGMTAIWNTLPTFAPQPFAWGAYQDTADTYFFICEFIEMDESELPKPDKFCSQLAELHQTSVSPTGKFGFHVVTCNGTTPQKVDWEDSWEVFFANGLRHMLELDLRVNGDQPELIEAITPLFDVVIPRLLRPLQEGSNPIKPVLLHGDMWWGNSAKDKETGRTIIFDASAFYGHNEYEMGNWRPKRSRFDEEYFEAYKELYPPAQPKEDYDDRILLYSMRFDFQLCILFPCTPGSESMAVKNTMITNMKYLVNKYRNGSYPSKDTPPVQGREAPIGSKEDTDKVQLGSGNYGSNMARLLYVDSYQDYASGTWLVRQPE